MPPKGRRYRGNNAADPRVQEATPENLRIEIDQIFRDFLLNDNVTEYIFTSDLNNLQRKYIHERSKELNLISKSYGREPNRQLHIKKKPKPVNFHFVSVTPSEETQIALAEFSSIKANQPAPLNYRKMPLVEKVFVKLADVPPTLVPQANPLPDMIKFKQDLPIFKIRSQIIETIRSSQVVVISSETGSGKTTQIPQYLMEDMRSRNLPCKIVCTQPRRISTVGVAERVADERNDTLGYSVGYHIRLEHKYGAETNLIYCTNGVLLRTLMNGIKVLRNVTHVIVDEIHERDCLSDFLLINLRKAVAEFPNLRVVLMSATVNVDKFKDYFVNAAVITVPGRLYPIQEFYLDEILPSLQYMTGAMLQLKIEQDSMKPYCVPKKVTASSSSMLANVECMDEAMDDYLENNNYVQAAAQLEIYFLSENVPVNYQHSVSGMTVLMMAALIGDTNMISQLSNMGADLYLTCNSGHTCFDYARQTGQVSALQLLNYIVELNKSDVTAEPSNPESELLSLYDKTHLDDEIDFDLIVAIIERIHGTNQPGAILVFLPGYDDIMICNERILQSTIKESEYKTFFLHGSMSIRDQHEVFKRQQAKRKIILSTNIAETSITIDDVVFVIDSGKAKEKSYDAYNRLSSLTTQWISKACAKQRAGRAGRTAPGQCYHIYSKQRHDNLDQERVPEILRISLDELCLQTKILAPRDMEIMEFFALAPDPPSSNAVKASIESLVGLGALDENENLTSLGEYLAQLTIEPRLGKMLIYSVIFKCLEPILTLTAVLAHKDPFQLPPQANLRSAAAEKRKALTNGVLSDHLIFLQAFLLWQSESMKRNGYKFCHEYFISQSAMETILETRRQLLGQLRAAGFVPQSHSIERVNVNQNSWPMVKAAICSGLYPNVGIPQKNIFGTKKEKKVYLHSSSVLSKVTFENWVIFDELAKNRQNLFIRNATAVSAMTIALVGGNNVTVPYSNHLLLDDWLEFDMNLQSIIEFRQYLTNVINKIIANPLNQYNNFDDQIIQLFNRILLAEDLSEGLKPAEGIGGKPKFFFKRIEPTIKKPYGNPKPVYAGEFNNNINNGESWRSNSGRPPLMANGLPRYQNNRTRFFNRSQRPQSTNYNQINQNVRVPYNDNPIFFLIKPQTIKNVQISFNTKKWVFSPQTERKIMEVHSNARQIYLVFSVKNLHSFNGIAKFLSLDTNGFEKPTAYIDWHSSCNIDFSSVRHLKNGYNGDRPIYEGEDGQVIERSVGLELLRIYDEMKRVQFQPSTSNSTSNYHY